MGRSEGFHFWLYQKRLFENLELFLDVLSSRESESHISSCYLRNSIITQTSNYSQLLWIPNLEQSTTSVPENGSAPSTIVVTTPSIQLHQQLEPGIPSQVSHSNLHRQPCATSHCTPQSEHLLIETIRTTRTHFTPPRGTA